MLYVTGNSHSCFFTGTDHPQGLSWWEKKPPEQIPDIKVMPIGACTAWNFRDEHLPYIYRLPIPKGAKILLMFGEIDCRWQIPNRCDVLSDAPAYIEQCQKRFFDGIGYLRNEYKPAVWCAHYTARKASDENIFSRTAMFRAAVVKMWNERAALNCEAIGVPFFNISESLTAPDGLADESYLLDDIHLNQKAMPIALKALGGWQND